MWRAKNLGSLGTSSLPARALIAISHRLAALSLRVACREQTRNSPGEAIRLFDGPQKAVRVEKGSHALITQTIRPFPYLSKLIQRALSGQEVVIARSAS